MQSIQTLTLIGKVLIRCVLHNISLKFKTVCFLQTKNCFVLAWLIRLPVFSAKQRLNPQGIYSFPVEYHLVFGNMSCPGCAIITSLLIALKRKMSFLLSSILQNIFSCLTIFCFWVSFIFTLGNTRMAYISSRFYSQDKAYLQYRTPYCREKRQIRQSFQKVEKVNKRFYE